MFRIDGQKLALKKLEEIPVRYGIFGDEPKFDGNDVGNAKNEKNKNGVILLVPKVQVVLSTIQARW